MFYQEGGLKKLILRPRFLRAITASKSIKPNGATMAIDDIRAVDHDYLWNLFTKYIPLLTLINVIIFSFVGYSYNTIVWLDSWTLLSLFLEAKKGFPVELLPSAWPGWKEGEVLHLNWGWPLFWSKWSWMGWEAMGEEGHLSIGVLLLWGESK